MPETLFISDLHLDAERPEIIALFREFLHIRAPKADALYILGDLFEYWLGDDDPAPALQPAVEALWELSEAGMPVYYLHGNRDFLISRKFARQSGCQLLPQQQVIELYGTPTLIMHGDTLCTDDIAYQRFRRSVRNRLVRRLILSLSLKRRQAIATKLRAKSRSAMDGKQPAIMDVNAQAVESAMRDHGVRRLIHGHTHRPDSHDFELDGTAANRIVLGDWYDQGSLLRVMPEGHELLTLSHR